MTIIAGGVMAHSLIPPTPGPLFVAEELGIDLGAMIMGGLVIGIITITAGYAYAYGLIKNGSFQCEIHRTLA